MYIASKQARQAELIDKQVEPQFDFHSQVSVVDRKGIFARSPLMGRVIVDLDRPDFIQGVTEWFILHDDEDDSE